MYRNSEIFNLMEQFLYLEFAYSKSLTAIISLKLKAHLKWSCLADSLLNLCFGEMYLATWSWLAITNSTFVMMVESTRDEKCCLLG